jgi:hypothetical protein
VIFVLCNGLDFALFNKVGGRDDLSRHQRSRSVSQFLSQDLE